MIIGARIRRLREQKGLSLEDIEERTGLLRRHISRVENGHTIPSLETLERLALAREIPLYQLFYEGDEPPVLPDLRKRQSTGEFVMDQESEKEIRFFEKVRRLGSGPRRPMLVLETIEGGEEGYLKKLSKPGSWPWWVIATVTGVLVLAFLGSILK